ncbi:presqualene diphosphate synthase HpnD [Saccharopolyspora mangrovi]|uniref:Presqualene diphosphate synthase HpnD n=1 Tax=Saccharopolyspora mangrovi TaxID=3082379 RepID=A0ABU6AJR5_9PSEU|nr:presqualene diphosphate synthase HpnD [Saccharopolyspora sp. S2-29]MEB3371702.1 presqualene diphosphate synthase HpnD [Saccharopolyspora sp. S2-29]
MTRPTRIRDAYQECERITREQARNFSYGIRLLPGPKRRALSAVYAFARRVDDIGDGDLPSEDKLRELKQCREAVQQASIGSADPVLAALADAASRMPLPMEAFDGLIDGCEADVRGTSYASFDELLHYCRCVAGTIGRLSLGVFGTDDPDTATERADALGVALQLTNILRDVREDQLNGRVYLPAADLAHFGVRLEPGSGFVEDTARWNRLVRFQAARAERWYIEGFRLLPMLDRRSRACCASMAGIYHELLVRIATNPSAAMHQRTSLSGWRKAGVAARSLAGMTP